MILILQGLTSLLKSGISQGIEEYDRGYTQPNDLDLFFDPNKQQGLMISTKPSHTQAERSGFMVCEQTPFNDWSRHQPLSMWPDRAQK